MIDIIITSIILLSFAFMFAHKAKLHPDGNPHFFDLSNSGAMRGLWSIIVVLVHTPELYQNLVQDMAGSFAYVGVTFFFLTSSFGLTLRQQSHPEDIHIFWRSRLPKVLIPQFLCNILFLLLFRLPSGEDISFSYLWKISSWVRLLLCCYFLFWCSHVLFKGKRVQNVFLYTSVAAVSLLSYSLRTTGVITSTVWPTELWGFIWGSLLAAHWSKVQLAGRRKWTAKCILACAASLILGLMYLKFKPMIFWGDYLLKILLGASILIFILLLNTRISIGNKAISFLGKISYEIYLVHGSVFSMTSILFHYLNSGTYLLISILITILLAAVLHLASALILKRIYQVRWFTSRK